ncbi:MAG: hypothetical protein ABSF55_03790 [Candidatus Staskawiczbacteria bacterium]|jgi:hypothetical protein
MKDILQSKLFRGIILGIAGLIILAFVFGLGVFIGMKRADFSFQWAEEYHQNFGGPQGGIFGNFMGTDREFANANGSFGQIIKIDPATETLTIKDASNNVEKNILVSDKTTIVYQRKNIKLSDLKLNDSVVVIGDPNSSGQIQAELIRVMPQKPGNPPATTTAPTTPATNSNTPPPGYNY